MVRGKEFKLLIDMVDFINRNSIKKEDIIDIGTQNDSIGGVFVPDFFYIVFNSDKEEFEEPPVKMTF